MFVERVIGDAELSRRGSLAAGSSQVQITGGTQNAREEIFIPTIDFLATRAYNRSAMTSENRDLSRVFSRASLSAPLPPPPSPSMERRTQREREKRRATRCSLGEHVKRAPKGLQVFAQLAYEGATFFLLRALACYILFVRPTFGNFAGQFRFKIARSLQYKTVHFAS